jgi:hypothetical protein
MFAEEKNENIAPDPSIRWNGFGHDAKRESRTLPSLLASLLLASSLRVPRTPGVLGISERRPNFYTSVIWIQAVQSAVGLPHGAPAMREAEQFAPGASNSGSG